MSKKLHPLHSPEWVAQYIRGTGEYPGERCTGRSTAQALELLAAAIKSPGVPQSIKDHYGTMAASADLMRLMQDMARCLNLRGFVFSTGLTVTLGQPKSCLKEQGAQPCTVLLSGSYCGVDFGTFVQKSYEGRCKWARRKGYRMESSMTVHYQQLRDRTSWVHEYALEWYRLGGGTEL